MGGNVLKLRSDYHDLREVVMIYIRDDIERQVDHMCTCGEAIARKNLQKGIEQGRELEKAKNTVEHVEKVVQSLGKTIEEACSILGINPENYYQAKKQMGS